ncbi:hypothetical protein BT93_C1767 [Corymbia citriodora subsp. variegata]|nr:hypothetical protein BT93_C1767 [Corymbia citriodora subsp. variegata]KAF8035842.1 hypothetical protein BT93_C1767 [Corymbia citriodora subsp. variegata]
MKKRRRSSEAIQSVEDVPPGYEYDVFLSFRGPDTRSNFTDCLFHRLKLAGFDVFLDEELQVGKEISGELLKALDKSRIYIPIFSQNFAISSWCLREVAHMVEHTSNSDGKKEILPIFYDVGPEDVKLKSELYKKAITEHEKKFGSDELKRWEAALVKVAGLKGWNLKGKGHGEIIELVVREVLHKLNARNVDVPEYWVEDHRQIEDILKKLEVDSNGVHFLGIHGIGGIGKTVLAKVVFNKISCDFDSVCFLNDIRESSQHGLVNVQKKLLSSLVGSLNAEHIQDIKDGMNRIKRVCRTKKVLIVLDDLDKKEQLKKLAGKTDWFGLGSRIIFTTRNLEILKAQVESSNEEVLNQPKGILAYEVHEMEFDRAFQLFCKHAFKRDSPLEEYYHLAKKIVHRVGMLPLAVEVIGSFLYCHGSVLEQHFDNQKLWEDTLKQLDDGPFKDVRDALMTSYEGLEDKQKEIFLDIACFFTNSNLTYPVIMWNDCNYHPNSAIRVLHLQSLIKIGHDNKFWMHDQVRDLGRHIILEEYPRKFSRVWIHANAVNLLDRKERNEDVKALSLTSYGCSPDILPEKLFVLRSVKPDLSRKNFEDNWGGCSQVERNENAIVPNLTTDGCNRSIVPKELDALPDLRLVKPDLPRSNIKDDRGGWSQFERNEDEIVPNLTSDGCNQSIVPKELDALPKFVKPDLSSSNIEDDWGGWSQIQRNEDEIVPNLTSDGCGPSIVPEELYAPPDLRLVMPNLSRSNIEDDWVGWRQFQRNEDGIVPHLTSNGCSRSNVPEELNPLPNLRLVRPDLLRSNIKDDYGGWSQFQRNEDVKVPNLISNGCNLSIVPEELGALPNLRFLRVKGIDFFGNFENLVLKLCWLSWEVMHNKFYAENFHFVSLVVLDLSRSNIEDDWGGWSQFQITKNLKVLDLTSCTKLTRTPDFSNFMSLEILILAGCVKLITIDCSIGKLELLKTLNIKGCTHLRKLPALHSLTQIVGDRDTHPIERLQMRQRARFLRHSEERACGGSTPAPPNQKKEKTKGASGGT